MLRPGITVVLFFLLVAIAIAQDFPKLPKSMPGVVNIPHLLQQPTKKAKPVYPPEALQKWVEATVVLDVVFDESGNVQAMGCEQYCKDQRPDLVQSALDAVRQWHWDPVTVKGKAVKVRTRVPVEFALDASTPPISVCNILKDPQWFYGRVVNVEGVVDRVAGVNVLTAKECSGKIVIAMNGDATPVEKDAKYAALEQALAAGPAPASLRGLIHDDSGPGRLAGERIVLQRVLQIAPK